ncbi:MAG: hypothetical protein ACK5LC_02945 [Coprobacillaceae bacterium]
MNFSKLKEIQWKWYHFVVFCLPGGTIFLSALLALELKRNGL